MRANQKKRFMPLISAKVFCEIVEADLECLYRQSNLPPRALTLPIIVFCQFLGRKENIMGHIRSAIDKS